MAYGCGGFSEELKGGCGGGWMDHTAADYEASVWFGSGECEIEDFAADLGMVSSVLIGEVLGVKSPLSKKTSI